MTKQQEKLNSLLNKGFNLQFNRLHEFYYIVIEKASAFRLEKAVYFSKQFINNLNKGDLKCH